MEILYDHQIFSSQKFGGVSRYFMELLQGVNGHEDMTASILAPLHCNDYLKSIESFAGYAVPALPKIYRLIQPINQVLSRAALTRKRPDVIHETYYQFSSVAPKSVPVVVSAYDLIHEKYHSTFRVRDNTTLRKRAALRRADHVIAISESTRQDYINFFNVPPEKITTVHLASSFTVDETQKIRNVSAKDRPYILYVGGRSGYKNFANVLTAYASSANLRHNFSLMCFGGGGFTASELARFDELGVSDRLLYSSGSDENLRQRYKFASVFVYPSLYEGFGLPPLEAMALGCPVVATNKSSVPEVVGAAALLFNPLDIDEITHSIERVLSDELLRDQLVEAGFNQAKKFSWKNCVDQTVSIYKTIARLR